MEWVRLGDIATYINGYAFKPSDWKGKGIPIIRIQNLNDKGKEYNYFDGEIASKYLVNEGDILISWSASIGVYQWEGQQGVLNQHIFKVEFDKVNIDKAYFKYMVSISLNRALQYMQGSTMKHITKPYFDNISVPLPSLETQIKIANILDQAQELIDKRKAQIEALDELIQSVFYDMFGDPIRNPKGYEKIKLGDYTTHVSSGSTPKGGQSSYLTKGIPLIRSQNVLMNKINYDDIAFISEDIHHSMKRSQLLTNDVLLNITGASIGRVAVYNGKDSLANVNQHVCIIRLIETISPIFLSYLISTDSFQKQIQRLNSGVTREALNYAQIRNFDILKPPIELQNQFAEIVENIEKQKELLNKSLLELETNFNSLMQRAFRGELVVE